MAVVVVIAVWLWLTLLLPLYLLLRHACDDLVSLVGQHSYDWVITMDGGWILIAASIVEVLVIVHTAIPVVNVVTNALCVRNLCTNPRIQNLERPT